MRENDNNVGSLAKIIIVIAAIIIAGSLYFLLNGRPENIVNLTNNQNVQIGGPFSLTDQESEVFDSKKLEGSYSLIYFGFTYCPDICPDSLQKITNILDGLKTYNIPLQPVFITIDPKRDTPKVLKDYIKNFHPNFIALTGSEQEIKNVANLFKVYYQKASGDEEDYMLDHSAFVYLMDRSGKYLAHFDTSEKADVIAHKIVKILRSEKVF